MPVAVRTKRFVPKVANPQADPRFQKVKNTVGQKSAQLKKHPTAKLKANEAAKAAKGPPNEKAAGAKANQVDTLKNTKAETPPPVSFLAVLRAEIDKVMPSNLEESTEFMDGGAESEMKGAVGGNVKDQKETASGDLNKASKAPPNEGSVPAKPVEAVPPDPNVPVSTVNGGEGMPAPKSDAEISEDQTKADAKTAMKENRLDGKRLENKDSRFETVKAQKGNVDKTADASPKKYRAGEKQALGKASAQASVTSKLGMSALTSVKNKSKSAVSSRQAAQKQKDELRRKAVTDRIEGIYTETKIKVDANLNSLERDVMAIFDSGSSSVISSFKSNTKREIDKYKDERYSGLRGAARWIADKFRDTPPEIKRIIQSNLKRFTASMDALAVRVAGLVDKRLNKAKADIDAGQAKIKAFVASLPRDLKSVGQEAEKAMDSRFNEMRDGVEAQKNSLAQKLAEKYKAATDQANELAKAIEEENKGAFKKLADAIGEIIKIILEFKNKLMALLKKAADAIELILDDPIGFLGNLISAIKLGVNQFVGNIWTHLKAGFMKWLFGSLADAGIEIPTDLSLVSLFKMVMSVLGLTIPRMKAKAIKLLGPTAVAVIEKLIEYVSALITGGPAKLWEQVKADVGDLKVMIIDAIQSWLIDTIIKQATIKLLSFFNPAGAFVQAVIAIYNTVMFIVENAAKIMTFVEAVINSISSIAQGAIGAAASWIEKSLASMIPLLIGFLARLIGLGGLSKKVKEFITKVQDKVDKAIDKVIGKIVQTVKKLFGKLSGKPGKKERTEAEKKKEVEKAAQEAKSAGGSQKNWLKVKLQLRKIKSKYDLTSLAISKKGKSVDVTAEINPKAKAKMEVGAGGPKADVQEAQGGLGQAASTTTKAAAKAKAAKAPRKKKAGGKNPEKGKQGKQYEETRRQQLAARPDTTLLPTKKSEKDPHGIDAALLIGSSGKLEDTTLEIVEIKEGKGSKKVFEPKSSSKGIKVKGEAIPMGVVAPGEGSAHVRFLKENPQKVDTLLKSDKERGVLISTDEEGVQRKMDNELSGITANLSKNLEKMYGLMEKAAGDSSANPKTITLIRDILSGKGGTLKFVIDIQKGATMSEAERDLARTLLEKTFQLLTKNTGEIKTKLELVLRTVDEDGKSEDEKL